MIEYRRSLDGLRPEHLEGFFGGWPDPPSPSAHLAILNGSDAVELAIDTEVGRVVGFANALSDGVLMAYMPLLEVLPDYRGRGIGSQLARRLLSRLSHLYGVDVVCDPELAAFYERLGMTRALGMVRRKFQNQSGGAY